MKRKTLQIIGLLILVGLSFTGAYGQSGYDDFQRALRAERSEGDLERAIALYEQVVREAPDQSLAARAQLRIGMCYEKMGLKDALDAYQRVIQAYPKQQREVALAKERLATLAETEEQVSAAPRFRQIRIPGNLQWAGGPQLSPDGEELVAVLDGALWLFPVHGKVHPDIAGKPEQLTDPVGASGLGLSWAADGQWVAFNSQEDKVFLVRRADGALSEVPLERQMNGDPRGYGVSLSPDGTVLAYATTERADSFIEIVPVSGGTPSRLTKSWTSQPAFSPDGSKIAYVRMDKPYSDEPVGEIWVVAPSGGTPVRVSDIAGKVGSPIWSPDGNMIAFLKETGSEAASIEVGFVSVSPSGKPMGPARSIRLPRGPQQFLAGWTHEDRIGIPVTNPFYQAIYTLPSSGGKALQVSPRGGARHPRWSPDGERIYFRWARGDTAFVPAEGGSVTVIEKSAESRIVEVTSGGGNAVSPDGSTIVFSAYQDQEGDSPVRVNIWTMPVDGGTPIELTGSPNQDRFPCWSADSETIAFVRGEERGQSVEFNIWTVSANGGEPEQFTLESDNVAWSPISWSPDGSLIAYFSTEETLRVISVPAGESREVAKVTGRGSHNELTWSPRSDEVAFTSKGRIWRVLLSEGVPREVETGFDGRASNIDWSPNGEAFAFTASTGGGTVLVLMEDFLAVLNDN